MRKIILDCDLMKHRNSGLYYYCLNLGMHVKKELEKENRERIFFYGQLDDVNIFGEKNYILDRKINFIGRRLKFFSKKWQQIIFETIRKEPEIWHAPFQSGRILPEKNENIKIVLTIHDLNALHETTFSDNHKAESLKSTQSLIDRSDALVCISEFCRQDVLKHLDVGNKPIYVIHNGTNKLVPPSITPEVYHPQKPFLFSIGYINRKKNFHVLIPLLKNEPELELVIAGKVDDPGYFKEMESMASDLGVRHRLHLIGQISEADKSWYLKNCLAFMFPSLAEGFGLPVTEAMHFGKPLFLSNRTSLPEIGGDVAFYFSGFDPVNMRGVFKSGMTRYEKEGLYNKILARGKEFTWEKSAKEYIKVYQSLFNHQNSKTGKIQVIST